MRSSNPPFPSRETSPPKRADQRLDRRARDPTGVSMTKGTTSMRVVQTESARTKWSMESGVSSRPMCLGTASEAESIGAKAKRSNVPLRSERGLRVAPEQPDDLLDLGGVESARGQDLRGARLRASACRRAEGPRRRAPARLRRSAGGGSGAAIEVRRRGPWRRRGEPPLVARSGRVRGPGPGSRPGSVSALRPSSAASPRSRSSPVAPGRPVRLRSRGSLSAEFHGS